MGPKTDLFIERRKQIFIHMIKIEIMLESSHKGWDFLPNQANARRERNDAGKPLRIAGKSPMSKERKVGI